MKDVESDMTAGLDENSVVNRRGKRSKHTREQNGGGEKEESQGRGEAVLVEPPPC